jgi:hypothetical protein
MANLLCSILIGNGFDAYVVHGYAPRYISLHDQSTTPCPLVSKVDSSASSSASVEADGEDEEEDKNNPYTIPQNILKNSAYLEKQKEKQRIAGLDSFVLWSGDAVDVSDPVPADDGVPRVHAWVLVRPGRRDVKETMFLEPSTGRAFSVAGSPYLGIETLWNHQNFWINMEPSKRPQEVSAEQKCAR